VSPYHPMPLKAAKQHIDTEGLPDSVAPYGARLAAATGFPAQGFVCLLKDERHNRDKAATESAHAASQTVVGINRSSSASASI
jgi:hypothetical protein